MRVAGGILSEFYSQFLSCFFCSRSKDVIEPLVLEQWFVSMVEMSEMGINVRMFGGIFLILLVVLTNLSSKLVFTSICILNILIKKLCTPVVHVYELKKKSYCKLHLLYRYMQCGSDAPFVGSEDQAVDLCSRIL